MGCGRDGVSGRWLGAEMDAAGRVKVGADLSLPEHPEIFVIGDTACCVGADGKPLPGVAPSRSSRASSWGSS
jgi:NADH:ubiquinone reductase (H+-translocating)